MLSKLIVPVNYFEERRKTPQHQQELIHLPTSRRSLEKSINFQIQSYFWVGRGMHTILFLCPISLVPSRFVSCSHCNNGTSNLVGTTKNRNIVVALNPTSTKERVVKKVVNKRKNFNHPKLLKELNSDDFQNFLIM